MQAEPPGQLQGTLQYHKGWQVAALMVAPVPQQETPGMARGGIPWEGCEMD